MRVRNMVVDCNARDANVIIEVATALFINHAILLHHRRRKRCFVAAAEPVVVLSRKERAHFGLRGDISAAVLFAAVELAHNPHGLALFAVDGKCSLLRGRMRPLHEPPK